MQKRFSDVALEVVPIADWVDALRARTEDIDVNPAVQALDFYGRLLGNLRYESPGSRVFEAGENVYAV